MKHVIITMRWLTTVFCVVILVIPRDCQHSFTGVNSLLKYFGKSQDGLDVNSTSSPIDGQWNTDADHHSKSDQLSSDEVLRVTDPGKGYSNSNLVRHAALPRGLAVFPMPLTGSDHELAFNVTWKPPIGPPVRGYSIEVHSVTDTVDCHSSMCYEYDIPGDSLWSVIPTAVSPVPEGCAVRPGCAYQLKVIAHPWDGHTAAYINVELDECVAGVCSCAHAPRLPRPDVVAEMVVIGGELFVNVTWSLPPPPEPLRLPPRLRKQYYFVSIGKKMVSDAHPAPWYAHAVSRRADAFGFVSVPEDVRWLMLPISERSGDRSGDRSGERNRDLSGERSRDRSGERSRDRSRERSRDRSGERSRDDKQSIILDVKLLARVTLVDERGCVGPVGNATAYDPSKTATTPLKTFMIWAIVCGACVLMMIVLVAFSARVVKRVLREFRPASSDPLQPLGVRPAWFQFGTNGELPSRGRVEDSPLYVHKDIEPEEEHDEWEVSRSRVHLGALIGSGAFGQVHAAQLDMPGGESVTVAAKMLSDNASEEAIQDFLREIVMLKHVGSHKHVIRLVGCCTGQNPIIALLEHAPRGDLLSLLRAARGRRQEQKSVSDEVNGRPSEADTEYTNISDSDPPLSEDNSNEKLYIDERRTKDHYVAEPALQLDGSTMREYALQVALGMQHLEEKRITHRDLAARNILVDGAGVLKVADFGLSRSGVYVHTRSCPVPLRWLAPEAIYKSQYCSATDVWAFAVLLWEIATLGGFPYAELSNQKVPQFLTEGGRLPKPARASPRLYSLMVECWSENPMKRPTFTQIVNILTAQQQLYVDLDNVFPPQEDNFTSLSDYDLTFKDKR